MTIAALRDRDGPGPALHLRAQKHTVWILGTAFALRLLVVAGVALTFPKGWLYTRGMEMGLLAQSIVAGKGLSSPFGGDTGPTAFIAPGYPLFVASVFKLFGTYSSGSALAIMVFQIAANLVTIWLLMRLASELFNTRTALLAGWISACSLPLLWMPTILWDTSLSACAVMGIMTFAARLQRSSSGKLWAVAGGCCGLTSLINPALLPATAAILGGAASLTPRKPARNAALAVLAFAVIFGAWPVRNARVFHAFVPTRTTVGFELWMGNHPGSSGFLEESLFPMFNPHELAEYKQAGEIAYTGRKTVLAESYVAQHPRIFLTLTLKRIFRFWSGTGTAHGSAWFVMHATLSSVFGLAGLLILFLKRNYKTGLLFLLPIFLFPVPYYTTHAEFRYRLVLDPVVSILAAYGFLEMLVQATGTLAAEQTGRTRPQAKRELAHG